MLSYQIKGQGIPVVLLHAFPLSSEMWKNQIADFAGFAQVIAPDLPGFGKSVRLSEPSLAEAAKEVSILLEHLKISRPVFLGGLSMGGYIAFEFFRQFPQKVSALGLFSTRAAADTPEGRQKRLAAAEAVAQEGLGPFSDKTVKNLLGRTSLEKNPDLAVSVQRQILRNSKEGVIDALKAMAGRVDSTPLLQKIGCPALIMGGAEDGLIPSEEVKKMAGAIQHSELKIFPQAGHLIHIEAERGFNETLADFIRRKSA